jgi:hypothetical protein
MRDLDPAGGFQQAQKYYTNQNSDFNSKVGSRLNNSSDASQNDSFLFSAALQIYNNHRWKGCNYPCRLECVWI